MQIQKKIRQSNRLVESPYAQEFTAHEIKLFEIAASGITVEDMNLFKNNSNKRFRISTNQLAQLLNTSVSTISHEIEKTAIRIMKKFMHLRKIIDNGTVEFQMINIIPFAQYQNGIFEFDLNYMVFPYLLEINSNFTEYELKFLLSLNSAHGIKLYKLLVQYKNIKCRVFLLDELKEQFGILDKYPQYGPFKKYVIDSSINQINLNTDIYVSYNEIKVGRKVESIEFIFELKKLQLLENKEPEIVYGAIKSEVNSIIKPLEADLSSSTKALISEYKQSKGLEYVETSISYAKKHAKTNLDKYLADTLKKGWAEVEIKKSKAIKVSRLVKSTIIKEESEKIKLMKDRNNSTKLEIEQEWNKLLDFEQQKYLSYSESILEKFVAKLISFSKIEKKLPLCIYAVNNNKSYNHALESYLKQVLNLTLYINN